MRPMILYLILERSALAKTVLRTFITRGLLFTKSLCINRGSTFSFGREDTWLYAERDREKVLSLSDILLN